MFVLYLAKKYIVPLLAEKCTEFLEANLAAGNAITVLQQAIQFDEKKLERKSWHLIDLKTSEAIASDAFADINQATLTELLKRDSLNVKELDLFKAVLKWSEVECLRKGIEANAKNKRTAIGNAIYQIRFSSMTLQEFGQITSLQSGVLTPEELVFFYEKFSGVERSSEVWNMSGVREKGLLRCCRFDRYSTGNTSNLNRLSIKITKHAVCVSFSKPVKIHGVRLLGDEEDEYDVKLEVFSQSVENKFLSRPNSRGISGFDVMVPVPIKVQADVVVHLKVTITGRENCRIGSRGGKKVETNGITVHFFNTPGEHSGETSVEQGQFDEIIFSEILQK